MENVLQWSGIAKKASEYSAFPYWPKVVGEQVAKNTLPEKIIGGKILVVRVLDAVWAQELALQKHEILDKLHSLGTGAPIEDIRFTTGDPKQVVAGND